MALCIEKFNRYSKVPIILLVIVSFLCLVCWTAPQAHAISMTVTVGIVLLCIAMLAAFGMTVTAPDNTSAINYLMPKVLSFAQSNGYSSIEDWVAGETGRRPTLVTLFSVIGSALVIDSPIWNCLLEYTKSFVEDEGITSGGDPVGELGYGVTMTSLYSSGWNGTMSGVGISDNQLQVTYTNAGGTIYANGTSGGYANLIIYIEEPATTYTISCVSRNMESGSWAYSGIIPMFSSSGTGVQSTSSPVLNATGQSVTVSNPNRYHYLRIADYTTALASLRTTGTMVISISGTNDFYASGGAVFTPGDTITEPDTLDLGENGLVYVPGLVDSMSPEDALNHVADKTATPGGLTAEPDKDGYPIPAGSEWLFDKLTDIDNGIQNQNPHTDWIPENGFVWSFEGIWHYVEDWVESFAEGVSAVVTVWSELPPAIPGAFYGAMVAAIVIGVWRRFFEG